MADNVTVGNATGQGQDYTVAGDEVQVGGTQPLAQVQFVKLVDGTLNGTAPIPGDATNGLDVDVTRVQGNVTVVDGGGSITVDGSVSVTGAVDTELTTADLDTGAGTDTRAVVGLVRAESGGGVLVGSGNPLPISGTVTANAGTGPFPVSDNGGSLTVDGSVSISGAVDTELPAAAALADNMANPTTPLVGAALALWDGAAWDRWPGTSVLGAKVHNNANASEFLVQAAGQAAADASLVGHNPLAIGARASAAAPTDVTADGDSVYAWALRNGSLVVNVAAGGTLITGDAANGLDVDVTRVGGTVTVGDGGGSLTVDAPVGTPVAARLSDGTAFLTTPGGRLHVDASGIELEVGGPAAADAPVGTNPVVTGGRASTAVPTAVSADGDAVNAWFDRRGAQKIVMVDDAGDSAMDGVNDALRVNVVAGGGAGGGTSASDDSVFTPGTTAVTPIGGFADETAPDSVDEGDVGAVRMTLLRALHVNLRDASGNEVSAGGGTQYDEDTVAAAAEKITMAGVVRRDTASSLVDLDGDRTELIVDSTGRLHATSRISDGTNVASVSPGGRLRVETAAKTTDDAAFAVATDDGYPIFGLADETATDSVDEGDVGVIRMTLDRKLLVRVVGATDANRLDVDASGRITANAGVGPWPVTDNGGSLTVDGTVSISGTVTVADANLDNATLVDNAAFTDGTTRLMMAGYIFDEVAGTALTENDAAAARVDSKRAVVSVIEDETTRGRRATVTAANALKVDGSAVTQPVSDAGGTLTVDQATAANLKVEPAGAVAHDGAISGAVNPLVIGVRADTIADAAPGGEVSADDDVTQLRADRDGALFVQPYGPRQWHFSNQSSATQTDTSVKAAGGAGISHYITSIFVAANGAVTITVEEGTATFKWRYYAAAAGDGAAVTFPVPMKITANTAITYTTSGAIEHTIVVTGFTAPG